MLVKNSYTISIPNNKELDLGKFKQDVLNFDTSLTVTKVPALEEKNSYILIQGTDARAKEHSLEELFVNSLKDKINRTLTVEEEIFNIKAVLKYHFNL